VHAEQNVIIQASRHGVSLQGATIYCTTQPCFICAKMLANAGVAWVRVAETYDDPMAREVLQGRVIWQPCE
jgi:dCMP deaminase